MSPAPHTLLRADRPSFLRFTAGAAALVPLASLTACSGSNRDPNTIRIA